MLEKKILLVLAVLSLLLALIGCSSGGGGQDDLDIAEIQEIEQVGEFSEDEFFASGDLGDLDEEQLVEDVPGLEEDLEVSQEELEASGDEDFEVDLTDGEEDLFAESGLAEEDLTEGDFSEEDFSEEGSIAQNDEAEGELGDLSDEELEEGLEEGLGEDVAFEDFESDLDLEDGNINETNEGGQLALESEEDLFRDLEEESQEVAVGETFTDTTSESSASELLADDDNNELTVEDINVDDVDYSQTLAEDSNLGEAQAANDDAPRSLIPVKKMKTVPYDRNGVLVNAIYFVRNGDTLRSIADKVYGVGSAVDFTIVNPHLSSGNLRVGQKVYYNSPTRSQDRSRLLTYYEDAKVPVMSYPAREGENIREISKSLLGHSRSWMEVWAANLQIESKGALESPHQIRYWEGESAGPSAPILAQNQPESTINQENLNVDEFGSGFEDPVQEVASNESTFDSDTLEEPIIEDGFANETNDLANAGIDSIGEPLSNVGGDVFDNAQSAINQGFKGELPSNDRLAAGAGGLNAEYNPRGVALNNRGGGFSAQNQGGIAALMNDPNQVGIVAVALVLLLGVGFVVVRRRKASNADAMEMASFNYGGETVIDGQTNRTQTQIDV